MDRRKPEGEEFKGEERDIGKEEPRQVVRVFLSQSRSMEEITARMAEMKKEYEKAGKDFDFTRLFFTTLVWAEKSKKSEHNAGQVMPVGGNIEVSDNTASSAAMREVLEETHLRVLGLQQMNSSLGYTLDMRDGRRDIQQTLFFAHILPTDTAYPLDPVEDKIKKFHEYDLEQMGDLFSGVMMHDDNSKVNLLGNLRLPLSKIRKDEKVIRNNKGDTQAVEVYKELAEKTQDRERKKRENIINYMHTYLSQMESDTDIDIDEVVSQFFEAENFFVHQKEFQKVCSLLQSRYGEAEFMHALQTAIEASNIEEEILEPQSKESYIEAVLHSIYALLETQTQYDIVFDIAKKNTKVASFVEKIEAFVHILTDEDDGHGDALYKKSSLKYKLSALKGLPDELVTGAFCEAFGVNEDNVNTRLSYINTFLQNLGRRAIIPRVSGTTRGLGTNLIDTTDEIKNAPVGTLARYAFPFGDNSWKQRFGSDTASKEERKRFVFEARRQLALLYLYTATDEHYNEVVEKGNNAIAHEWETIVSPTKSQQFLEVQYNKDKSVIENITLVRDLNVSGETKGRGEFRSIDMRKSMFEGKPTFLLCSHTRTKDRDSLYRKIIERGLDDPSRARDIFGRSLVIGADMENQHSYEYIRRRETRQIRVDGELKNCSDVAPLLDIMEYFSQQDGFEIFNYSPTPKDGEVFQSRGVGGGSNIRLGKFYIRHTDENDYVRHEEVQVYTPSTDKSSFFWYEQKKHDDARYYFERLMNTKGFRSVLELLYPTAIYGHAMHAIRGEHTRDKKSRVRTRKKNLKFVLLILGYFLHRLYA